MVVERLLAVDPEEWVQDSRVTHVDLGCLDLTPLEVGMPGLELPQRLGIAEQIEVPPALEGETPRVRAGSAAFQIWA